jgi:hypothetical protein
MRNKVPLQLFGLKAMVGWAVVITEIVFVNSLASAGFEFILSSVLLSIAVLIQLRFAVHADSPSPADIVIFIFNWLFLDLAPKIQLMNQPQQLVNTSSVAVDRVALTNLVCAIFMVAFTLFYQFLTRRARQKRRPAPAAAEVAVSASMPTQTFNARGIGVAVFCCVAVVGVAAPYAYASVDTVVISPSLLVMNRFLLFLPSATLLILLHETIRSGQKLTFSRVCVLLLLFLLVAITENPYTEKRNALGPVYIGLILIAFQTWFSVGNRRMLLLICAMVLIFPASSLFTHNHQQTVSAVSFNQLGDAIADHYFSVNYDSWANIYTTVEFVHAHSMQWGHQLLGSLLFFVPSALWTSKPLATGIFLANYLINNYSMWFTNLSAPFIAEGYLDFGYLGVVAYAGITAVIVNLMNRLAARQDRWAALPMAVYGSIFLMLVMRGSLMVAMGFASAAFLSFSSASALLSLKLDRRRHRSNRRFDAHPTLVS